MVEEMPAPAQVLLVPPLDAGRWYQPALLAHTLLAQGYEVYSLSPGDDGVELGSLAVHCPTVLHTRTVLAAAAWSYANR